MKSGLLWDFWSGMINGLREIWAHKFRSFLSMTGIVLGVAALVSVVGVVQGMVENVRAYFENVGGITRIYVEEVTPPDHQQELAHLSPGLTYQDAIAIEEGATFARLVDPEVRIGWRRFQHGRHSSWAVPQGVTTGRQELMAGVVSEGRFIADLDLESASSVVVLSAWLVDHLFPEVDEVVGKTVMLGRSPFTVIGVIDFEDLTSSGFGGRGGGRWRQQRIAYIPITTAMRRFQGNENLNALNIHVLSVDYLYPAVEQVENILLQTHNQIEDFEVRTMEEQLAEFRRLQRSFTFSLGGVALISLLVGGIGIMNVMLAAINERIREIGVRKAVGARGMDIFIQFLAEAAMVSALGGLIGMVAAVGLIEFLRSVVPDPSFRIIHSPEAMIFAFVFSVIVGMVAGVYPAIKAAKLDVIDALRYE